MLLKIIIVLVLIGYVFNKVTSFLFKRNASRYAGGNQFNQSRTTRKAAGSDLNIDNVPNRSSRKNSGFSGGEYVDYEEIN